MYKFESQLLSHFTNPTFSQPDLIPFLKPCRKWLLLLLFFRAHKWLSFGNTLTSCAFLLAKLLGNRREKRNTICINLLNFIALRQQFYSSSHSGCLLSVYSDSEAHHPSFSACDSGSFQRAIFHVSSCILRSESQRSLKGECSTICFLSHFGVLWRILPHWCARGRLGVGCDATEWKFVCTGISWIVRVSRLSAKQLSWVSVGQ